MDLSIKSKTEQTKLTPDWQSLQNYCTLKISWSTGNQSDVFCFLEIFCRNVEAFKLTLCFSFRMAVKTSEKRSESIKASTDDARITRQYTSYAKRIYSLNGIMV